MKTHDISNWQLLSAISYGTAEAGILSPHGMETAVADFAVATEKTG